MLSVLSLIASGMNENMDKLHESGSTTESSSTTDKIIQPNLKPKRQHPRLIITAGCRANSIDQVAEGLQVASDSSSFSSGAYRSLLVYATWKAIENNSISVLKYLIYETKAPVDSLNPLFVSMNPSIEILSILTSHGWDINYRQTDREGKRGQSLLDLICRNEKAVQWCLEHGASVEEDLKADWFMCPPLLETVARSGSLNTFRLLQERGAKMGERTLHRAVESAATSYGEDLRIRMEIVKYLVEDLGIDVNQMDTNEAVHDRWGTPLCYAAKGYPYEGGKVVTQYLLEKGADPYTKDIYGNHNAFTLAAGSNKVVSEVLEQWKDMRRQRDP